VGAEDHPSSVDAVTNGVACVVVAGTHKGKAGLVEDRRTSKTGHVTISVLQADGVRFKTLARNVTVEGLA
jgi:ribosomal protein S4E